MSWGTSNSSLWPIFKGNLVARFHLTTLEILSLILQAKQKESLMGKQLQTTKMCNTSLRISYRRRTSNLRLLRKTSSWIIRAHVILRLIATEVRVITLWWAAMVTLIALEVSKQIRKISTHLYWVRRAPMGMSRRAETALIMSKSIYSMKARRKQKALRK